MKQQPDPYSLVISQEKNAAMLKINADIADWIRRNPEHAPKPRETEETTA